MHILNARKSSSSLRYPQDFILKIIEKSAITIQSRQR